MANKDKVRGFRLMSGSANPHRFLTVAVDSSLASAIAVGDAVARTGTLNAETGSQAKNARNGLPNVQRLAAGGTNGLGIVVSIEHDVDNQNRTHIPASTGGIMTVCTDTSALYEVQEDSDGAALVAADAGQLIDLIDAGPSSLGVSGMELDSSTVGASGQFRLVALQKGVDNALGAQANWLVTWAEHEDISDAVAV